VDAVDLNPTAVELARLNVALNSLESRVRVFEGNLWAPLAPSQRYDHVVCNPPLVPVPEGVVYPLCGHGGADGLEVVRRILGALDQRLTARGRCTLIGACTGTEGRPAIREDLDALTPQGFGVSLTLLLQMPLRDWVGMLVETIAAVYPGTSAGNTILQCRARYGASFDTTVVYTYLAAIERSDRRSCDVLDYSTVGSRSYWFVNRGRVAS
jgi:methylase of polypeptide subunit release factors